MARIKNLWRHLKDTKPAAAPSPQAEFISRLVKRPGESAQLRLQVSEYPAFQTMLHDELGHAGKPDADVLLAGRLVGVCPNCRTRLSYEYLRWLSTTSSTDASHPHARSVLRFAAGQCVNEHCSGSEILLYWRPD